MPEACHPSINLPPPPRNPPKWAVRRTPVIIYLFASAAMIILIGAASTIGADTLMIIPFAFLLLCLFMSLIWQDKQRRRLHSTGEVAEGVVIEHWVAKGSATLIYTYSVEGSSFRGSFGIANSLANRIFASSNRIFGSSIRTGLRVIVMYDSQRPWRSTLWGPVDTPTLGR